ncbi:MAG TPA: iron-siderophore ABC transporter substrate-binding protein, partial [Mycobacterium sp.]
MPFFTPRVGLIAAATALATAVSVTLVSGCDSSGGAPAQPSAANSVITSTTKVAGANVLGNERRPDES